MTDKTLYIQKVSYLFVLKSITNTVIFYLHPSRVIVLGWIKLYIKPWIKLYIKPWINFDVKNWINFDVKKWGPLTKNKSIIWSSLDYKSLSPRG